MATTSGAVSEARSVAAPEILLSVDASGGVATVTLNRASKLNALNLNMIRLMHLSMDKIDEVAGELGCMVMDAAGGKAFCAGGDVASVRAEALAGGTLPADFFFEEYAVVFRLATLFERTGCCQISLWDGITMGGGVGLSVHGPIRVVTEKTSFAKPEMAIGLFPDVGSTHMLSRLALGPHVGLYLGITGERIGPWDCLRAGLATHYVPSADIPRLRSLLQERFRGGGLIGAAAKTACEDAVLEAAAGAVPTPAGALFTDDNVATINRCFAAATLEDIVANLRAETSDFASTTLRTLTKSCSPTSCKVTMKAVRDFAGEGVTIGQALQQEYRLAQRFTTRPQPMSDFFEGIRAVLVDKDRKQQWNPGWSELHKITDDDVAAFFAPLDSEHRRGELSLDHQGAFSRGERKPFPEPIFRSRL
eukprot:TRINITY_DN56187_c0_g1_i1.p1 TRINITY_DN56187_c0_g1~~TRINITY_DN56187_c0_g1_i1.p1  ORF type:complete len:420 (+),score=70.28 TRINITY_DN56187_c0_g1_i1:75-1334(+)